MSATTKAVRHGADVQAVIAAVRESANTDSSALHHLANIVKLAAFACEARRVLNGTSDVLHYYPEAENHVKASVSASRSWTEFDDVAGDVLQDVAMKLAALSDVIDSRPHELVKLAKAGGVQ